MFLFPYPCLQWCEHRGLLKQSSDTIEPLTGCGMKPSEVADAGKASRQDVLQETAKEFLGIQGDILVSPGFAVAIVPPDLAVRQKIQPAVAGGSLEDITRRRVKSQKSLITQGA